MPSLVTLPEFRSFLKLAVSAGVPELQQYLDGAEAACERYCRRKLALADYTEFYSGTGQKDLPLNQPNVVSVTTVHLDSGGYFGDGAGAFAADTLQTAGSDYVLVRDDGAVSRSGILRRLGAGSRGWWPWTGSGSLAAPFRTAAWPAGDGNIKVEYTAGYDVTGADADVPPADLKLAILTAGSLLRQTALRGGLVTGSERLGEYSYSLLMVQHPDADVLSVRQLLAPYVVRAL